MAAPRYIEDFAVGETFETRSARVELAESIAFARRNDPQDFHTDPERARAHPLFRGLAVSGFYTMTLVHRLILAEEIGHAWGLVGKGISKLRWKRPVRPGDSLRVRGLVLDILPEPGQPFGVLRTAIEAVNQDDKVAMTMTVEAIVPSRTALAEGARDAA